MMKRVLLPLAAVMLSANVMLIGCSPSAPTAAPTISPSGPAKAAEPIESPEAAKPGEPAKAAAPTAARVKYPEQGRPVTVIVPWDPGSGSDVIARLLASPLERDLGVPIQVVNKPGAGTQIGLTELATAKPDGYTIGMTNQSTTVLTYLDPERKAVYSRKDFAPIATVGWDSSTINVRADSPYKGLQDLLNAAKADPEKVSVASPGFMTSNHLDLMMLQKATGVKFAIVQFTSGATTTAAVVGGHTDAGIQSLSGYVSQFKSGLVRVLGVMSDQENRFAPGVKTMEAQGYRVYGSSTRSFSAPAGTPKEIVDRLATSLKQALDSGDVKKKMDEVFLEQRYMGPGEFGAYWEQVEADTKTALSLISR